LPEACYGTVKDLEDLCSQRRQLSRQERLYRLLHGWLKIHVPCSVVLFVLVTIHAIGSLYY
jgi:hypothetical protein